jgi:uncharacterized protein (TIGR00304 family)
MIFAGAALSVFGVATGEMQVALILFVPVVFASSILGIMAIGSIIVGVFVAIADYSLNAGGEEPQNGLSYERKLSDPVKNREFGGVVLIGPIPIVFGSSKRVTICALTITIVVLMLIVLVLFFNGR